MTTAKAQGQVLVKHGSTLARWGHDNSQTAGSMLQPSPKVHYIELNIKSTNLLHVCIHVDAAGQQAHYCFIEEGKPVAA